MLRNEALSWSMVSDCAGKKQYLQQYQQPAYIMRGTVAQMWRSLPLPLTQRLAREARLVISTGGVTPLSQMMDPPPCYASV